MATVVNARDVQLQAAGTRLLGVQMQPNIEVDPSNVTGLGLIIEGTKLIWISATSQVFQVPKSGSITPGSITLTANVRNIAATATISLTAGTMSITPTLTGNVFTFTPAQMTSDSITLRVEATEGSTTYFDDMTIAKVSEGIDALTGLLTNETVALPASNSGVVANYATATGNFKVYQGINDVTSVCTYSIPSGGNPDSLTASITPSGAGAGTYSVTGGFADGSTVASLTLRATFGSTTIDKVFTLTKSKAGTNGTDGSDGIDGQRGSQTFYVAIAGTSFSDSLATSTASSGGGPILNDLVVQYNSGAGFSQSKFWDGTVWTIVNAVVDGNLLVSGTVGANKISTTTLAAITANLGTITAGNITLDTSGFIRGGQTAYNTGTGYWLGYSGGAYKFSIGDGTKGLLWDGTNLTVNGGGTFTGSLAAATVDTGGLTVSTTGYVRGGQTAYNTGTGFFLGYSGGAYKFSIGNPAGNGLTWDGTDLLVTGKFTASAIDAVNTINIAGEAVTVPVSGITTFTGAPSATETTFVTLPATNFKTSKVQLFIYYLLRTDASGAPYGSASIVIKLYRTTSAGTVLLHTATTTYYGSPDGTVNQYNIPTDFINDTPGDISATYSLTVTAPYSLTLPSVYGSIKLLALGTKK